MIRRLRQSDTDLLREAYRWDRGRPSWYIEMDRVFNGGSEDDFIAQLDDPQRAFIGVWDNDDHFTAVILIRHHGSGRYEGHLMARKGTDAQLVSVAIQSLLHDLLDYGLVEAHCWVAERNIGIRRLCANIQFQPDGVSMWRGSYRNRVIKWQRYSIQREQIQLLTQQAA